MSPARCSASARRSTLGGVLTLGVVGMWWFLFPPLRDIDRFEDVVADEAPIGVAAE